ncbi:hypothetical protein DRW41_09850 [Neobacillus piezotolerans]|uniref:Uncharacterized protein n=1 Tax=Neobacillus piezotolerans TaxID=2259171 RepID=A0A3D8GRZ7_9BACI|nr:hypothetical protein DRW41_09850 [Neobacillus piezotolerans]
MEPGFFHPEGIALKPAFLLGFELFSETAKHGRKTRNHIRDKLVNVFQRGLIENRYIFERGV